MRAPHRGVSRGPLGSSVSKYARYPRAYLRPLTCRGPQCSQRCNEAGYRNDDSLGVLRPSPNGDLVATHSDGAPLCVGGLILRQASHHWRHSRALNQTSAG